MMQMAMAKTCLTGYVHLSFQLSKTARYDFLTKNPSPILVESTLQRIYACLVKFVANGDGSLLVKTTPARPESKVISMDGQLVPLLLRMATRRSKCRQRIE